MREVDEAAERVMRAMRALDAHRHEGAPTLEREYRRSLEAYFVATQDVLLASGGDDDEDATAADVERTQELREARASIEGHYAAARRALRLARVYGHEADTSGRRERECIEAVQRHRDAVRAIRMIARAPAEQLALPGLALPGLAKTRPGVRSTEESKRSSQVG